MCCISSTDAYMYIELMDTRSRCWNQLLYLFRNNNLTAKKNRKFNIQSRHNGVIIYRNPITPIHNEKEHKRVIRYKANVNSW